MNFINKFGETSNNQKLNSTKLGKNLLKTFDISIKNKCLDLHEKRISNLATPIDLNDAVTKAYLTKRNNFLSKEIENVKTALTLQINKTESVTDKIVKDVNEILKLFREFAEKEDKIIEKTIVDKLPNINKNFINKIEEKLTEIEKDVFKTTAIEESNKEYYSQLNIIKSDVKKLQSLITKDIDENVKVIENAVNEQIFSANKDFVRNIEARFNKIEDYIFKNIDKKSEGEDVKKRKVPPLPKIMVA